MNLNHLIQLLISQFYLLQIISSTMNRIAKAAKSPSTIMRRCRQEIVLPIIAPFNLYDQFSSCRSDVSMHHLSPVISSTRQLCHSRLLPFYITLPQAIQENLAVVRSSSRIGHHEQHQLRCSSHSSHVSQHNPCNHSVNRYERFRRVLVKMTLSKEEVSDRTSPFSYPNTLDADDFLHDEATSLLNLGKHAMEVISSNRRSFNRSWKRMKPLIELILQSCRNDEKCTKTTRKISSIADVGCDHGLLTLSLACMAWVLSQRQLRQNSEGCEDIRKSEDFIFDRVTGTDLSSTALGNGANVSHKKLMDAIMAQSTLSCNYIDSEDSHYLFLQDKEKRIQMPIEFRVGYGLEPLQPGEADAIVMAGMGHLTMLEVLFGNSVDCVAVNRIHTQRIFLQPTNSRPQHMIELYDRMQESGEWELSGETIAHVGGRYYINSYFERKRINNHREISEVASFRFPGHFMVRDILDHVDAADSDSGGRVYDSYVKHHIQWLKEDYQRPQYMLDDEDRRWLEYISSAEENEDRWKDLVSWYSH